MPCSNMHLLKFGTDLEVYSGINTDDELITLLVLPAATASANIQLVQYAYN